MLHIDLNKHVWYSPEMVKVIREKLSKRYDSDDANEVWKNSAAICSFPKRFSVSWREEEHTQRRGRNI